MAVGVVYQINASKEKHRSKTVIKIGVWKTWNLEPELDLEPE